MPATSEATAATEQRRRVSSRIRSMRRFQAQAVQDLDVKSCIEERLAAMLWVREAIDRCDLDAHGNMPMREATQGGDHRRVTSFDREFDRRRCERAWSLRWMRYGECGRTRNGPAIETGDPDAARVRGVRCIADEGRQQCRGISGEFDAGQPSAEEFQSMIERCPVACEREVSLDRCTDAVTLGIGIAQFLHEWPDDEHRTEYDRGERDDPERPIHAGHGVSSRTL